MAGHAALYREAIEFIARLQRRGAELASETCTPYRLAFDVEKLTWELDFFVTAFLEGYRGAVAVAGGTRRRSSDEWTAIAGELAAEPRVLCHRDYHSRNLMVHDGGLFVIDFQDARMGPDTYDLVSLLRDSYVDINDARARRVRSRTSCRSRAGPDAARVPPPIRSHGRPAQPQGARHVRQPGGARAEIPSTFSTCLARLRTCAPTSRRYPRFARLRELLAAHIELA